MSSRIPPRLFNMNHTLIHLICSWQLTLFSVKLVSFLICHKRGMNFQLQIRQLKKGELCLIILIMLCLLCISVFHGAKHVKFSLFQVLRTDLGVCCWTVMASCDKFDSLQIFIILILIQKFPSHQYLALWA